MSFYLKTAGNYVVGNPSAPHSCCSSDIRAAERGAMKGMCPDVLHWVNLMDSRSNMRRHRRTIVTVEEEPILLLIPSGGAQEASGSQEWL